MEDFENIPMVDLKSQYQNIKDQIDQSVISTIESSQFIGGSQVESFKISLQEYLKVKHVIPCANGTDALQIALMALGLKPGDEVIVPAFTYVATAEVIGLLGLIPIMVDVDLENFNILIEGLENKISSKTKAIVPVHLFGQASRMEDLLKFAKMRNLFVIEDNAQALGADYFFKNGSSNKLGTIGDIGCTSFFPSKNLGCYGDGGALMTNDDELAEKIRMIANHGQSKKYHHKIIGCNSRLDSIQAAVLNVKLKYLDKYNTNRKNAAAFYIKELDQTSGIVTPITMNYSSHVFHQFTLKVKENQRDHLKDYLQKKGIPSMIYYPIPLYDQEAFRGYVSKNFKLENTEALCKEVLSLPMHSELKRETQEKIIFYIKEFFNA
jgi:UDP-2-acetamido-2-deoxy-ribo-hexuluronate aminotransferase